MLFQVMTAWTGTGTEEDSNRPLVADTYAIQKWTDVTGQPAQNLQPDPNLYTIEAEAEESVVNAIEADNDYFVVWSEA